MTRAKALSTRLALLRGINVGGKNMLPMKNLAEMFTQAGCTNVRTYIQSGNVIFDALPGLVKTIPALIANRIEERFGLRQIISLEADLRLLERERCFEHRLHFRLFFG